MRGVTVDDGLRQNTDLNSQFAFRTRILKVVALPQFIGLLLVVLFALGAALLRAARGALGVCFAMCAACCNSSGVRRAAKAGLPALSDARFEAADAGAVATAAAAAAAAAAARGGVASRASAVLRASQWHGPPSYAMAHDPRFAALFADPTTGARAARTKAKRLGGRALLALQRAAVEGFVIFDAAAAVNKAAGPHAV